MNRYITENGIEVPAVTTEQMRAIDSIAMEETVPNLYQMMKNSGWNLCSSPSGKSSCECETMPFQSCKAC